MKLIGSKISRKDKNELPENRIFGRIRVTVKVFGLQLADIPRGSGTFFSVKTVFITVTTVFVAPGCRYTHESFLSIKPPLFEVELFPGINLWSALQERFHLLAFGFRQILGSCILDRQRLVIRAERIFP